jgi:cytochrome c-type biogenesis protein CcmH/NrfG
MDTVLSPRSNFRQRQAAWKELKNLNQLDHAVTELEQRVAAEPQSAEAAAALGEAYLKKCEDLNEFREQAIYAMKADQLLETALKLDPANWDARFTKAVGMSYWPAELNKSQEVIEQFQTLIQQQSSQPQQSYFAKPYVRLGEQYVKAGRPDYATQVWQAGAALFPDNSDLKEKLSAAQ